VLVTRTEFLEERKTGIGGSDAASLFGIGYGCQRRLWYDKSGVAPDYPLEESTLMELGALLEPFFVEQYEQKTGRQVVREKEVIRHPMYPELLVHVDGSILGGPHPDAGVLEIKSVGKAVFYKVKKEGLPEDYVLQMQHGMLVTDRKWGSFGVGSRDSGELLHWDVERDEEICNLILREGPSFFHALSNEGAMPRRLDVSDPRCQKCAWRVTCQGDYLRSLVGAGRMEADESLRSVRAEYLERKALVKEAEVLLEETRDQLETRLGDRTAVWVAGHPIYFKPQTSMRWDTKSLEKAHPELAEAFKKPSVSRPLLVMT
jgi:predicted phage-related endonuclease